MRLLIIVGVLFASCTIDGQVGDIRNPGWRICTDFRDDSTFRYHTDTIKDVRLGLAGGDTCFTVQEDSGKERTLCKSHESWLRCDALLEEE